MSKRRGIILFGVLAAAFLILNRGAYQGYFSDDDLDNLSWTRVGPATEYLKGVVTPRFFENNFRPVGHFYFHASEKLFGLDFPKYVGMLQAFHLLNVWLVWLLARKLGATAFAAGAGVVFLALHMALFDAVWKPMYVFDVLCGLFCLLSVNLYARSRWVWSLICFWLAYKCKELAVMLPVVLAVYEWWFGKRQWARLTPFVGVSLLFGVQSVVKNPNPDNDYTFRFTTSALRKTLPFYMERVFLIPYLGFVLPLLARRRLAWFGLAWFAVFLLPLLFLPGRVFSAYCYVPFAGLGVAFAGFADAASPAAVVLFFLLWVPQDIHWLRLQRRETLARAAEVREWVTTLAAFARTSPDVGEITVQGAPAGFAGWGVDGTVKYLFPAGHTGLPVVLKWDAYRRKLDIIRGEGLP
jgi:hypothetical protein